MVVFFPASTPPIMPSPSPQTKASKSSGGMRWWVEWGWVGRGGERGGWIWCVDRVGWYGVLTGRVSYVGYMSCYLSCYVSCYLSCYVSWYVFVICLVMCLFYKCVRAHINFMDTNVSCLTLIIERVCHTSPGLQAVRHDRRHSTLHQQSTAITVISS